MGRLRSDGPPQFRIVLSPTVHVTGDAPRVEVVRIQRGSSFELVLQRVRALLSSPSP